MLDTASRDAVPARAARRDRLQRLLVSSIGIGLFYIVVVVFFTLRLPGFLSVQNIAGILATSAALGLVAIGQTFAIVSGGFDLSVGGTVPLAAVTYALASQTLPSTLALLVAILVGCLVGVLNAVVVARLKINPLITTLGTLSVAGGFAYVLTDGLTLLLKQEGAGFWGDVTLFGVQHGVVGFLAVALLAAFVLRFTSYGRAVYAVGGNAEAAELAGIRVRLISGSVYVISGACAAFAGVILASQLLAGAPNLGVDTTLNSVTAVILGGAALTGGIGGVGGTVLGVLLIGTIANGLALLQVSSFWQTIATGAVLLLAVIFSRSREIILASLGRR